jgi:hypothetical protein
MKRFYGILLISVLLAGCAEHAEVQLPKVPDTTIATLYNHSPAYIFYDTDEKDSTLLNRKNLIMNTNWVIHADARVSLKNLIPKLDLLYKKRTKKSIHSKEGMKNYFSVLDLSKKQLGFIDYTAFKYKHPNQHAKFYIKKSPEFHINKNNVAINFDRENNITVDGNSVEANELIRFLKEQINFVAQGKKTLLYLNFDERLSFEQYLNDYLLVSEIVDANVSIADQQFIYDYDELPDCNCKL